MGSNPNSRGHLSAEDCEGAITSLENTSPTAFCVGDPKSLLDGLPDATVEEARVGGTQFKLTAPNRTKVNLTMVESGDGWRIDSIGWGRTEAVRPGKSEFDQCEAG